MAQSCIQGVGVEREIRQPTKADQYFPPQMVKPWEERTWSRGAIHLFSGLFRLSSCLSEASQSILIRMEKSLFLQNRRDTGSLQLS